MANEVENPYRVLGVERTADERAIKKAYVALVRKFPPESHAEEFQKIRAAYECLTDPAARARFDDSEKAYNEYDQELSRKLAEADLALERRKVDLAREILQDLRTRFPDATIVVEKLGLLHLSSGSHAQALVEFQALAKREPENARHHFHCGLVFGRLDKPDDAAKALATANKLDPKDVPIALALIDCQRSRNMTAEALRVVDATLPRLDPKHDGVATLLLRKLALLAERTETEAAEKVVEELYRSSAAAGDPEVGRRIARGLGRLAAELFAGRKPAFANTVLAQCSRFTADAPTLHPLPTYVDTDAASLPPAFRTWLEETSQLPMDRGTLKLNPGGGPFVTGIGLALVVAATSGLTIEYALGAFPGLGVLFFFLLAGALTLTVRWLGWVGSMQASKLRPATLVHPLYLIQTSHRSARLYPLLSLTDTRGTHQHTNGVYTGTALWLSFGDARMPGGAYTLKVTIQGQAYAQKWLDSLLQTRGRALELLAEGILEAEERVDLLPPRVLAGLPRAASTRGAWLQSAAIGMAAALILSIGLSFPAGWAAADTALGDAAAKGTLGAWRAYLDTEPDAAHAAVAKAALDRAFAEALVGYTDAKDPARAALGKALEHVRDHGGKIVYDVVTDAPFEAVRGPALRHLVSAFGAAGLGALAAPDPAKGAANGPGDTTAHAEDAIGPRLTVTLAAGPARTLLAGDASLDLRGIDVTTRLEVPGQPPLEQKASVPAPSRVYAVTGEDATERAQTRVVEHALDLATQAIGLYGPAASLTAPTVAIGEAR